MKSPELDLRPIPSESDAISYLVENCFNASPPGTVGVELEWLLHDPHTPQSPLTAKQRDRVVSALDTAGLHGVITTEPGGQLELSSQPASSLAQCLAETAADLAQIQQTVASAGLRITGLGLDPIRRPRRITTLPRYVAMEEHFDQTGPHGRVMMCSTAAVQVCVESGPESGENSAIQRWETLKGLGPVLVACFANSPLFRGRPTGWKSTRIAVWSRIDPCRTVEPGYSADPQADWARYALDASVLAAVSDDGSIEKFPGSSTFREWITHCQPRKATFADLAFHLTTLFPPVRPRGFLEIRPIDAQSFQWWAVAPAVVTALLDDSQAFAEIAAATSQLRNCWLTAAREGLNDPQLAAAAKTCFAAALPALSRLAVPIEVRNQVENYFDRFIARQICPADEALAAWAQGRPCIEEENESCWIS